MAVSNNYPDAAIVTINRDPNNPAGGTDVQKGAPVTADEFDKSLTNLKATAEEAHHNIIDHSNNTNNPHNVTKAQVGLGNVDNTSDLDKPISTATQNALDQKISMSDVLTAFGNINNCRLYLPLQSSLMMVKGVGNVYFARSSTATYIDLYGVLKNASVDQPRFEKNGLLIEGDSANLLYPSEDLTDSNWTRIRTENPPTITTTAPDGSSIAYLVKEDTSNGSHYIYYNNLSGLTVGNVATISIFAKAAGRDYLFIGTNSLLAATATYYLNGEGSVTEDSTYAPISTKITKLADGWYRCEITGIIQHSSAALYFQLNRSNITTSDVYTGDGSSGIYMWGAQFEQKPFATSYIPTTTASTTRSVDICYATYEGNMPCIKDGYGFGIAADIKLLANEYSNYRYILDAFNINFGYNELKMMPNTTYLGYQRDATLTENTNEVNTEKFRALVIVNNSTVVKLYRNGIKQNYMSISLPYPDGNIPNYFYIGCHHSLNYQLYGHISNIRIWDFALTDIEAQLA